MATTIMPIKTQILLQVVWMGNDKTRLLLTLTLLVSLFSISYANTKNIVNKNKIITINGIIEKHTIINSVHPEGLVIYTIKDKKPIALDFDPKIFPIDNSYYIFPYNATLSVKPVKIKDQEKNYFAPIAYKVLDFKRETGKIKVKQYKNIAKVKIVLKHPMLNALLARETGKTINTITKVQLRADGKLVYDMKASPYLSRYPILTFYYKSTQAKSVHLSYSDSRNYHYYKDIKVKLLERHRSRPNIIPTHSELMPLHKSIKKLYGDIALKKGDIEISLPQVCSEGDAIPIQVKSNIKSKSVALFYVDYNVIGKDHFIAQWKTTEYSIIDYQLKFRADTTNINVIAVIQAEDGNYYYANKNTYIASGGMEG